MTNLPAVGTFIHALGAVSLCGYALRRGDSLKLTQELVELTIDKRGISSLAIVDDEEAQVEKYGERKFGRGYFPSNLKPWTKGSPEEDIERDRRRAIAHAMSDEMQKYEELRAIRDEFGDRRTSRTTAEYR
jgi:hypothetical protein